MSRQERCPPGSRDRARFLTIVPPDINTTCLYSDVVLASALLACAFPLSLLLDCAISDLFEEGQMLLQPIFQEPGPIEQNNEMFKALSDA